MVSDMEAISNNMDLNAWWEGISFAGKENYSLKEGGELVWAIDGKEHTVATVTAENADTTITTLKERYVEAETRVKELETEWVAAEDKLKLYHKVEKTKEYLSHLHAAGDIHKLLEIITGQEKTLHELTEENYATRLKLVETGEALVEGENFKQTTQAYKDLADQWKVAGFVDKKRSDALWNRLEAAKSKFYERKKAHKEDYDKEMLQNLDLKMELVEKAEAIAASESWKQTTEAFKQIMEQWKAVGHTMHDKNEALWNKLIAAKSNFFDRKKAHFETIQVEQETNYTTKQAFVEKAEAMQDSADWAVTAQAYTELMDQWKKTGRVPAEKGDELWNRFTAAKEVFFKAKKVHFGEMKSAMDENLAKKTALVQRAEALQNATHWQEVTQELNELMDEWKKTGPVTREHSKKIWDQFLAARKNFFDRKDANRDQRKQQFEKHKQHRVEQAHGLVQKLAEEIKEEEERIADFKEGLKNLTTGKKEEQLRAHLTNLINEGELKIKNKTQKLDSLKGETAEKNTTDNTETPAAEE